nr:MAG TPA: hypothetical protein [Caudoviricetes sp.]
MSCLRTSSVSTASTTGAPSPFRGRPHGVQR